MARPFIASQKLLVLSAPAELAVACLAPGAYLTGVPNVEQLAEINARLPPGCSWRLVDDRIGFLADTSIKRLCFLVDAGIGKSTVLGQCAHVRHHLAELTDLPPHKTGHLVIDLPFTDLPMSCREYLDGAPYKLATLAETRLQRLPGRVPSQTELQLWLKALARRGELTLNIDALDQFAISHRRDPVECLNELGQFMRRYPEIRIVTSGRPNAILTNKRLFGAGQPWTFAVVCLFDDRQRETFVGAERAAKLTQAQIGAGELNVPRMLDAIRHVPVAGLENVRTASDIYWRALLATICPEAVLADSQNQEQEAAQVLPATERNVDLNTGQQLFLFAIAAIQLVQEGNTEGVSGLSEAKRFLGRIWKRRQNAIREELSITTEREFQTLLKVLLRLNKTSLDFAIVGGDVRRIKFQNRSFQNFFAALWCARHGDGADRQWLLAHRAICYTWPQEVENQHVELYEFWRLLCEMPGLAGDLTLDAADPPRDDAVFCRMVSVLFENGRLAKLADRPTELICRCWPGLLQIAGDLPATTWTDGDLVQATTSAQRRAWERAAGKEHGAEPADAWSDQEEIAAGEVIERFLAEFPRLLAGRAGSTKQAVARHFNDGFRNVPPRPDDKRQTWFSKEGPFDFVTSVHEQLQTLAGPFALHEYPVTNKLYKLFDATHAARFSDYKKYSARPDCPAIYLNWYDACCLAMWLHGRLPTELEWEYACRADPGGGRGPVDFWWSRPGESFDEARKRIQAHAWIYESTGQATRPMGAKNHANGFGLSDMLGNVWEWTASWWHDDALQSAHGGFPSGARVVRGGSFLDYADDARCSRRSGSGPSIAGRDSGVRVARASLRKS